MEKDSSNQPKALPRAKEVFKDKARVFDITPYLRDMQLKKLESDSSQKKARSISEYREVLHGLVQLLS